MSTTGSPTRHLTSSRRRLPRKRRSSSRERGCSDERSGSGGADTCWLCGFALPCFATNPRPNAWYTATCSVDADHMGQITGFELFASDDILQLPAELRRAVSIGSPWNDVFLWKETVLVGTPREIWNALEGDRERTSPTLCVEIKTAFPGMQSSPGSPSRCNAHGVFRSVRLEMHRWPR
jgi:hypothetical protein